MLIEVCAGSVQDCLTAQKGGAHRIELNSSVALGGVTPSLAMLLEAKRQVMIPIICMIRPRGGGFCYSQLEKKVMFEDAKILLENGADGLAFGFLLADGSIDLEATAKMIQLCQQYEKESVFHRAFDCSNDMHQSIQQLIDLQCQRILTSGLANHALAGLNQLNILQQQYGTAIELLAGSGITIDNVLKLVKETNIKQVHASFKYWQTDPTTEKNNVSYKYSEYGDYDAVSLKKLQEMIYRLKQIV